MNGTKYPAYMARPTSDVRDRILERAIALYLGDGLSALRVHDVANEAGASVATIYKYFDSRDGLIDAVLVELFRRMTGRSREIYSARRESMLGSSDVQDFIREAIVLSQTKEMSELRLARLRLLGEAVARKSAFEAISVIHHDDRQQDADVFAALQQQGRISKQVDPLVLSYLVSGIVFSQIAFEYGTPADKIRGPFTDMVVHAMTGMLRP